MSNGPEPRTIPDGLVGQPADAVTQKLGGMGLKVARDAGDYSETVAEGNVIGLSPAAGQQLAKGGTVTLTVSKGPPVVVIPELDRGTRRRHRHHQAREPGPGRVGHHRATPARRSPARPPPWAPP